MPPVADSPKSEAPKPKPSESVKAASANPPPGLTAPTFPVVDRTDPLSPDQLERTDLTVQQALRVYLAIVHVAKHPEQQPQWFWVMNILQQGDRDYQELMILARAKYEKQRRFRDLTARLPMDNLENIKAADAAEGALQDAWMTWRRVYATFNDVHQAIHSDRPIPEGLGRPPAEPDAVPASA